MSDLYKSASDILETDNVYYIMLIGLVLIVGIMLAYLAIGKLISWLMGTEVGSAILFICSLASFVLVAKFGYEEVVRPGNMNGFSTCVLTAGFGLMGFFAFFGILAMLVAPHGKLFEDETAKPAANLGVQRAELRK